ncbi:FHA domain-containing protein, partial [Jatrophihabitans sp.]|uniref:FHA domain-containing protein n=1 Tax=Jatrophihabitans sp. TaxID=1932789 RepID=UPI0030C6FE43|nr:hypothetical protein [Jatrophihabitans sp.]
PVSAPPVSAPPVSAPPVSAPPVSAPPVSQQPSIVLPPPVAPPPSPPAPARNFDHLFGATGAAPAAAEPSAEVTAEPAAEPVAAQPAEPVTAAPPPSASHETVHPLPQSETGIIESLPWQLPAAFTSASAAPRPVVTELPTTVTEPPAAAGPQFSYQPDQPSQPGQPSQPNDATLQPHHTTPPPGMLPDTAPPDTALPDTAPPHTAPPAELDSHTVDRASLTAGAAEQGREQGGPTVSAVICAEGHLSEVYAALCRVCGGPIAAQTPFNVRRPVLGLLALSTGDTVMLDRDVVLGRAPVDAREGVERSHVVQVDSVDNDISRTHVLVHLDGWHVLVTDLDSTNGTMVTLPGQAPTRLRPNDPFAIVPGTVVSLADEVTLRYEVPR